MLSPLHTYRPELIYQMAGTIGSVDPFEIQYAGLTELKITEKSFRWLMALDIRASDSLRQGIQKYFDDALALRVYVQHIVETKYND